jgi:hypothetical protein
MPAKTKPVLSPETVRLLRRVARAIVKHPELYNQANGRSPSQRCGTAGCILGWVAHFNPQALVRVRKSFPRDSKYGQLFMKAATALGLNESKASALWHAENWPDKFVAKHVKYSRSPLRWTKRAAGVIARNAAKRIEHFISTDGAE